MSREEKEKLLSEKMENIRRKNEELRKRHEEIEADKKNADKISSTVTMDKVKPYVMKAPRARPEKSERPREAQEHPSIPRPSDIMPTRQRLSENDGPPPDPSYRFLSDPDRDGSEKERKRDGRGKRKGKPGSKWGSGEGQEEEGEKMDKEDNEVPDFNSPGGQGNRGRGKSEKSGGGRGRGSRGRGYGRPPHEQEYDQEEEFHKNDNFESHGSGGEWNKPKSGLSFASRDIRYYPDENEDHRGGKDMRGRGRGRQNYGQWGHNNDNRRSHRRGDSHSRGGRGRINDQEREYEKWKAERAAIDEARLTRGKTDGGNWRREWDNDKINQGESEETGPVYDPRFPRSKSENYKLADLINFPNNEGPAQPSLPQRKVQRERRKGNSQESREKFVKVDTQLVQKQLKLGGSDPKESNWRSPPGPSQECDEKSSSDDVIVLSDDMNDTSDENAAEYEEFTQRPKSVEIMDSAYEEGPIDNSYNNDHSEMSGKTDDQTSEEVPAKQEASSERPKSVESMESVNECSYEEGQIVTSSSNVHSEMKDKTDDQTSEEIPAEHEVSTENPESVEVMDNANECLYEEGQINTSCDNDHSDMNDKIDNQTSEEIPAEQEISTERQKSVESMDSATEVPCVEGPIDTSCNNDLSEMNIKSDDPITSTPIKVNEELVAVQQTETSKEPIIDSNIICAEPPANE
ncbi:coiled-coil domain-containing protein 9-like isoform X2 [Palaemon carinicauda]